MATALTEALPTNAAADADLTTFEDSDGWMLVGFGQAAQISDQLDSGYLVMGAGAEPSGEAATGAAAEAAATADLAAASVVAVVAAAVPPRGHSAGGACALRPHWAQPGANAGAVSLRARAKLELSRGGSARRNQVATLRSRHQQPRRALPRAVKCPMPHGAKKC